MTLEDILHCDIIYTIKMFDAAIPNEAWSAPKAHSSLPLWADRRYKKMTKQRFCTLVFEERCTSVVGLQLNDVSSRQTKLTMELCASRPVQVSLQTDLKATVDVTKISKCIRHFQNRLYQVPIKMVSVYSKPSFKVFNATPFDSHTSRGS